MAQMTFTGPRREIFGGGWSRTVKVGEQEYSVSVRRGKSVRIPYRPRGKNRGWQWHGSVYRIGANAGLVWQDRVLGSVGCRGLMTYAGVLASGEPVGEPESALLEWFRGEFERRSSALAAGKGRIDWLDAGTRVSWSEVTAKADELGIERDPVDLRRWFHEQTGNWQKQ